MNPARMARLFLVSDRAEIDRRKKLADPSLLVEVWQDLYAPDILWMGDDEARRLAYAQPGERAPTGLFWMGEESKAALDRVGEPLAFLLALAAHAVPIYYGPRLCATESLPTEESLRARILSAHGIAAVWATYDPSGGRNEYQPASPTDSTFYLRRPRGAIVHLWRLFRTKGEAIAYAAQHLPSDPEAMHWADDLSVEDFAELLDRFGQAE